jgi:hypothetical protein
VSWKEGARSKKEDMQRKICKEGMQRKICRGRCAKEDMQRVDGGVCA